MTNGRQGQVTLKLNSRVKHLLAVADHAFERGLDDVADTAIEEIYDVLTERLEVPPRGTDNRRNVGLNVINRVLQLIRRALGSSVGARNINASVSGKPFS